MQDPYNREQALVAEFRGRIDALERALAAQAAKLARMEAALRLAAKDDANLEAALGGR